MTSTNSPLEGNTPPGIFRRIANRIKWAAKAVDASLAFLGSRARTLLTLGFVALVLGGATSTFPTPRRLCFTALKCCLHRLCPAPQASAACTEALRAADTANTTNDVEVMALFRDTLRGKPVCMILEVARPSEKLASGGQLLPLRGGYEDVPTIVYVETAINRTVCR